MVESWIISLANTFLSDISHYEGTYRNMSEAVNRLQVEWRKGNTANYRAPSGVSSGEIVSDLSEVGLNGLSGLFEHALEIYQSDGYIDWVWRTVYLEQPITNESPKAPETQPSPEPQPDIPSYITPPTENNNFGLIIAGLVLAFMVTKK
ncbi:MAG: hypothetical protein KKB31_06010 [Nanoarchaeota archaeon]|nr:hypothetical protein [Nanoarchaeota archaeon]